MKVEPKFYENLKDNNHCLQAAVMMVLNTITAEISWEEVNKITEYENNLYSWTPRTTVALAEKIPGTILISSMDHYQFAKQGEEYFRKYNNNSQKWLAKQKEHASPGFNKEQRAAQEVVEKKYLDNLT